MKLLVIGGTKFLGRDIVETAVARGHEVTMFNRRIPASPAQHLKVCVAVAAKRFDFGKD